MQSGYKMPEYLSPERLNRFWSRVAFTANPNCCWEWTGCKNKKGYGYIGISTNNVTTNFKSHRLAYYLHNKVDPQDNLVMHKCDNPSCCNPNHLQLGTAKDNAEDRDTKGRGNDGDRNPMSKLTTDDVVRMRELFKEGKLRSEIAKEYNTSWANAHNICTGKAWKHI